ncbi:MAG: hypothetical protein KA354_16660 [Phycisphaerae bacterium]|nr:hypothetical protein [Phycisphaerae bacterium]
MWCFSHQIGTLRRYFTGSFGHYATMTDEAILSELLHTEMLLHPRIRDVVERFVESRFHRPVIGVHVRFMDRRSRIEHFFGAIDRAKQRARDGMIFLATDNKEAERRIRERYGDVFVTEKWFPSSGVSMHQNPECPDRLNNAIEALVDMYLLAACDYLVYPGSSTFSQISALVSDMPRGNIYDIERYDLRIRLKRFVRGLVTR